jgi:ribosomal protein RSM22 (predicted rRNA methylase)
MTTLRERLIKIGANIIRHAHNNTFQMAQGAVAKNLFADILRPIPELRPPPLESTAETYKRCAFGPNHARSPPR